MKETLGRHGCNSKIFEYKGKPLVLLCGTEHYGAVMNRPFDFKKYVSECVDKKQNYTRLFLLFRELQCANNPYSTCKPESPDYVAPYRRTGPGLACDGLPKYDLKQWDDEFFERLHAYLALCEQNDIIVEVTLFSDSYSQALFELTPMCAENNINGLPHIDFRQVMSLQVKALFEYQEKYVEKIVSELNRYSNIVFEVCNEPCSFNPDAVNAAEVDAWQREIIGVIRSAEALLPNRHMIAAQQSWYFDREDKAYKNVFCPTDLMFDSLDIEIASVHPLPQYLYRENVYDLGLFMSKQLRLEELKRFCLDTYRENRIVNIDEDNIASAFRDCEAWTIHRKRAWVSVMCGAHYDCIDFSIQCLCPDGTVESRKHIRTWMKNLQEYISQMDIVSCRPLRGAVISKPDCLTDCVMGVEGCEYHIYLADSREREDEDSGGVIAGSVKLNVPEGDYAVRLYSPEQGMFSPWITAALPRNPVMLPSFRHDIVIQLRKDR
jgi:hypothetical protein